MIEIGKQVLFKFKDTKLWKTGNVLNQPCDGIVTISRYDELMGNPFIVKLDEIDLVEVNR